MKMKPEKERTMNASGVNILQREISFALQLVCHVRTWKSINRIMKLTAEYA
jgi:hypothetical protein